MMDSEFENDVKSPLPTPFFGASSGRSEHRAKSSLRLKYEAEIGVLKRKLGDLEQIRERLGISQRKACQLLMVDPSAWTRWTKKGEDAPPHIYRMLQWYLALNDKYPALDAGFWVSTVARATEPEQLGEARGEIERLQRQMVELREEISALKTARIEPPSPVARSPHWIWPLMTGLLGLILGGSLIWILHAH